MSAYLPAYAPICANALYGTGLQGTVRALINIFTRARTSSFERPKNHVRTQTDALMEDGRFKTGAKKINFRIKSATLAGCFRGPYITAMHKNVVEQIYKKNYKEVRC